MKKQENRSSKPYQHHQINVNICQQYFILKNDSKDETNCKNKKRLFLQFPIVYITKLGNYLTIYYLCNHWLNIIQWTKQPMERLIFYYKIKSIYKILWRWKEKNENFEKYHVDVIFNVYLKPKKQQMTKTIILRLILLAIVSTLSYSCIQDETSTILSFCNNSIFL